MKLALNSKRINIYRFSYITFVIISGLHECLIEDNDTLDTLKKYMVNGKFFIDEGVDYYPDCGWKRPAGVNGSDPFWTCVNGVWRNKAFCKS